MVLMDAGGGYTGPRFDYNKGIVIIRSLRSEGDGHPRIQYQLDEMDDLRAVLHHILGVFIETYNYVKSLHQFDRIINITIDGRNAQWHSLERQADPSTMTGGRRPPRQRAPQS